MRCPKSCPNKFCKAYFTEKERQSAIFNFCKVKKKMEMVKVELKCGHVLKYFKDQIGYHTSKLFYCPKCRKMVERKNGDFWKKLKEEKSNDSTI
jgi:hypothetical protein